MYTERVISSTSTSKSNVTKVPKQAGNTTASNSPQMEMDSLISQQDSYWSNKLFVKGRKPEGHQ